MAEGPPGKIGKIGSVGCKGEIGARGEKGDKGDTGGVGQQGLIGPRGSTCPRGVQGAKGLRGVAGIQGPLGVQGPAGSIGERGERSVKGEKGIQGDNSDVLSVLADHQPIQLVTRYGEKMCFVKNHVSEDRSSIIELSGGVETLRNVSAYYQPAWHIDTKFVNGQAGFRQRCSEHFPWVSPSLHSNNHIFSLSLHSNNHIFSLSWTKTECTRWLLGGLKTIIKLFW